VSEIPEPLQQLNVMLEAMFIAHETIYDLHRGLVNTDQATTRSRSLLAESARIVLQSAPDTSASARALASQWHEQSVLDPETAEETALELETEFAHADPLLRELLARESAIAAELRALAAEGR
jgi:hypothetical protein